MSCYEDRRGTFIQGRHPLRFFSFILLELKVELKNGRASLDINWRFQILRSLNHFGITQREIFPVINCPSEASASSLKMIFQVKKIRVKRVTVFLRVLINAILFGFHSTTRN